MDKETLLSGFTQRIGEPGADGNYGDTGISGRTMDSYIEGILPTITDDAAVTDDFYDRHVNFLKAMGGQMRHEKAEFVKNYKPQQKQVEQKGDDDKLLKRIEEIEKRFSDERKESEVRDMRSEVCNRASSLKVNNKELWKDSVELVGYKDGMTADEMTEAAKAVYEKKLKSYFGEGSAPYGGTGTSEETQSEEAKKRREEFKERMRRQGKLPKKD